MKKWLLIVPTTILTFLCGIYSAYAFCGFYVAKADASLYNKASQVVMARHEDKTVLSMMNDYQGDLKEFAIVVPVPEVLQEGQINVGEKALFEHIDSFTAPRLVEYFDSDPCQQWVMEDLAARSMAKSAQAPGAGRARSDKSLGVTVEAEYTVGEYDIVILSAKESSGLETWLKQNKYKIPNGASRVLGSYIKQDLKFFVAKVNLKEQSRTGLTYLRPIQVAYESKKFMLPIRLGMLNAKGDQELLAYILTKDGRVETTNYRTVKLPSNVDIPVYVKRRFGDFYKAMFAEQHQKENKKAIFTEYFWNMGWCDPCAADPLSPEELKKLGVFWLDQPQGQGLRQSTRPNIRAPQPVFRKGPLPVLVTRLHLRYNEQTFPADLMFKETNDKQNFQARYVLRHPWDGSPKKCDAARTYFQNLKRRQDKEAQNLASLTGWPIRDIRKEMKIRPEPPKWWESIWD